MPRGIPIDISAPDSIAVGVVDILPSPPPAYSQLPPQQDEEANEDIEDSEDEDEDSSIDSEELDDAFLDEEDDDERYTAQIDQQLVNDQDWENASGDLTKRYNRLRQHVGALSGEKARAAGSSSIHASQQSKAGGNVPLPAQNQHQYRQQAAALHQQQQQQRNASASAVTGVHANKVESALAALSQKYASALNLAPIASSSTSAYPASASAFAEPSFTSNAATRKGGSERHNIIRDKSDRATNEQVLDPRTRLILFKMLGRGLLEKVEGCVSTGKEANVYHAMGCMHPDADPPSPVLDLAIKIYKTSILTFKSRSKYLDGEFRFKNGYSKVKNPRKLVRLWAEKEMRNLKRLHSAGIRCPEPLEVRENVLVMTFLGKQDDGWEASPRLKDAELPAEKLDALYVEVLYILRRMYKVCKLVHADFSEYNILYSVVDEHLYTIDVSQSVEHDHPHAFDFLRADIANADEFFSRRGVKTLGIRQTFGLVIETYGKDGEETEEDIRTEMERRFSDAAEKPETEGSAHQGDEIFKRSYIPRTLNEVYDAERDVQKVLQGQKDDLIYAQVAGVVAPAAKRESTIPAEEVEDNESADEDDSDCSEEESEEGEYVERQARGKRHEDKEAKKERKQAVKEEKRGKRKEKMPKSQKKAKVKKTSGKKK